MLKASFNNTIVGKTLLHLIWKCVRTNIPILMGDCHSTLACFPDVLSVCIPEIKQCIGFQQNNPHHNRNVWDHTLFAVSVAPKDIYTRLALLYHDIGKPLCYSEDSGVGHFYGHAAVSRDIAEKSLHNLRFDNQTIKLVTQLVEAHDRTSTLCFSTISSRLMTKNFLCSFQKNIFFICHCFVHNFLKKFIKNRA